MYCRYLQRAAQGHGAVLRSEWMGTEEELLELASLPELSVIEYKEQLFRMLGLPPIGQVSKLRYIMRIADLRNTQHCSSGLRPLIIFHLLTSSTFQFVS